MGACAWKWEVGRSGVYSYVSPEVEMLLGYSPMEMEGRTPFDFMPTVEAARVSRIFHQHVESAAPILLLANKTRHKDGHLVTFETTGVPIANRGTLLGYIGMDWIPGAEQVDPAWIPHLNSEIWLWRKCVELQRENRELRGTVHLLTDICRGCVPGLVD